MGPGRLKPVQWIPRGLLTHRARSALTPNPALLAQEYEYSAPKFMELSDLLDGVLMGGDDQWFERAHPLHESRRPRKPPRSLLPSSPVIAKASPALPGSISKDMERDAGADSDSTRKRQRSLSGGVDSTAKRRLQQDQVYNDDNEDETSVRGDSSVGAMSEEEDDAELIAMIASHNASKARADAEIEDADDEADDEAEGSDEERESEVMELFHGTSLEAALSIQAGGFRVGLGKNANGPLGSGLNVTTTLVNALNYAKRTDPCAAGGGAIFRVDVRRGRCCEAQRLRAHLRTWQTQGYDSAWSLGDEELCIADPRAPRVQIVEIILGNTWDAARAGYQLQNGILVRSAPESVAAAAHRGRAAPRAASTRSGLTPRDCNQQHSPTRVGRKSARGGGARSARGGARSAAAGADDEESMDNAMMAAIAAHNRKFAAKCDYAPAQHSVRDVRAWERQTGHKWHSLNPEGRSVANEAIEIMKAAR